MKKTLTVFTPAYNRAHTIGRTYESLLRQTSKDFVWLIVDDGSSDNTSELVQEWINEGKLEIRYIRQKNQGMHGAHNTAYRNIDTELNTCIDSDDYMPDNAVEKIISFWREHGSDKVAGIIALDQDESGRIIGTRFPDEMPTTTLLGFYASGGQGDKKIVYRTDVINSYPEYPIFEGEKYVGLAYKYYLVDQDYELLTLNEPLVTVEYQADGSSYNMYNQYWKNPRGFAFLRQTEMKVAPTAKRRYISAVHYVAESMIARNRRFISEAANPFLVTAAVLPGLALYYHIRKKVKAGGRMNFNNR